MAKKFNFKLESVLKLRSKKVDEAQIELGRVMRVRVEREEILKQKIEYYNTFLKSRNDITTVSKLQAYDSHRQTLESEIKKLENERRNLLEIEKVKRINLTKAMKDEKAIEKLKEKQVNNHAFEINKEEAAIFDEIAMRRHQDNKGKQ